MRRTLALALAGPALLALLGAAPPAKSPGEIVAAAPVADWRPIAPDDLMVMELGSGARVVMELAPAFAPVHVANIRAFVRAHWFDGAAIVRVQDNYVVQWGGADAGPPQDATATALKAKVLPAGIVAKPPTEYERPAAGLHLQPLGSSDAYAPRPGFVDGWPAASDGHSAWLVHCYGMIGVGRDMPPDTGSGAELYTVIGQAPRHLDRNIALVGRVIEGMPALTALPRGTGDLGFYTDPKQNWPIRRVMLAADMPAAERPRYEAMRSDSPSFAAYLHARANRGDGFFVRPAGAVDLCNAPVPVRATPAAR